MRFIFFYLIVFLFLNSSHSSGQGFLADAINPGRVYRELKWDNIIGSGLLFEDWHKARIKLVKGKLITGVMVNFDVYEHKALYLNNNESFEFVDQLEYIETDYDQPEERKLFMNGFISNQFKPNTFVQVLNEGKYVLLKYVRKVLVDTKSYGSGNNDNKSIEMQSFYFISNNFSANPIKLSKSALEELAGSKKKELTAFLTSNNLSPKKEADFIKALKFCNDFLNN
ncbi:MAG: hypothetical protein ACKO1T_11110 [Sediminibacterium sp.]